VKDIHRATVTGLDGKSYLDKVDAGQQKQQSGDVKISSEVDRIYLDVSNELTIHDAAMNRQIIIRSQGSQTAVVWNPWEKIAKEMADLLDDDYLRLLCVETTNAAADTILIQPGSQFSLIAHYQVK
jgi:glucose-6-phosphate 1-epimerase